ncbi:MAG: hypothetical protein A2147_08510 [Chloroflexi bacterium RBG_16_57_8]|nr:MAG: hypothetical protein A2147_08510 [Chloroflexi bacterium RBG_16_57_8]
MKGRSARRPFTLWLLIILTLLIGISALISGPMLFLEPSGSLVQWSVEDLEGTPFSDYLIPGIILFVFIGIYPVFVGYSLIRKPAWRWPDAINPAKEQHWAWAASSSVGIIMLIWIIVETVLLGFISFLQPVIAVWAVLILLLAFLPGVRRYFRRA